MRSSYLERLNESGIKFGLERISRALETMGNPQEKIKSIVHVAGTNGKGTVCEALALLLSEAGFSVGLYTSPHISRVTERFKLNGREIRERDLGSCVKKAADAAKRAGVKLTYFELLTAACFLYFSVMRVDYLILEVGLGGRLDATNVVKRPDLVIIPSIALDHTGYLGKTLSRVAKEKGAVIKKGSRVILGKLPKDARKVIRAIAHRNNALVFDAGIDFDLRCGLQRGQSAARSCDYRGISGAVKGIKINTVNPSFFGNIAIVFTAYELLTGSTLTKKLAGVAAGIKVRGRLSPVRISKGGVSFEALMDGAHNPAAMANLVRALRMFYAKRKKTVVLNFMKDKDYRGSLRMICPEADAVAVKRIGSERALDPAVTAGFIKKNFKRLKIKQIDRFEGFSADEAGKGAVVVFCGSFYLLGEIEKELRDEGYKVSGY